MTRGGPQHIPRPDGWRVGPPTRFDPPDLDRLVARVRERGPGRPSPIALDHVRASAVLVVLGPGPEVLLTRRAGHLRRHSGEVSFPGGRFEDGEDAIAAALREAHEEVGLPPDAVEVVGELDHLTTVISASEIVPVVARLVRPVELVADPGEVDAIRWVSLHELVADGVHHEEHWGEPPRPIHFFELEGDTVWGATARMLVQLLTLG